MKSMMGALNIMKSIGEEYKELEYTEYKACENHDDGDPNCAYYCEEC